MNLDISKEFIVPNRSGFREPHQVVASLVESVYEQKSQSDTLTLHLNSKENAVIIPKSSSPTSIGLLPASNIPFRRQEKCREAGHDVQISNEDYKRLLSLSNIKAQRIAINIKQSEITSFSLRAKRFLVTWNGCVVGSFHL